MKSMRIFMLVFLLILVAGCSWEAREPRALSEILADHDRAIDSLETLLKADSLNSTLVGDLAEAMLKKVDFVRELGGRSGPSAITISRVERRNPLIERAIDLVEKGIVRDSGSSRLLGILGKGYWNKYLESNRSSYDAQSRERGMKALDAAIRIDSSNIDACLTQTMFCIFTSRYVESTRIKGEALAASVLRRDPENGTAYFLLCRLNVRNPSENELGQIAEYMDKAEEYGVNDADWWLALGEAGLWNIEPPSLYDNSTFMNRIRSIPRPVKGFFLFVANPLLASKQDRQMRLAEKALEVNPYHVPSLFVLAARKFASGKLDEALKFYQRADGVDSSYSFWWPWWDTERTLFLRAVLKKFPQNYRAWVSLASVSRRSDEQREAYEKAVALRPDFPLPYVNLAVVYVKDGRYDEAEDLVSRAVTMGVDSGLDYYSTPAYARLAEAYAKAGKDDFMMRAFKVALKSLRVNSYPVYKVASVYRTRGDMTTFKRLFDMYISTVRQDLGKQEGGRVEYELAEVFEELGDLKRAALWYEKAAAAGSERYTFDDFSVVWKVNALVSLATVRSKMRQYGEAIRIYRDEILGRWDDSSYVYGQIGRNYRLKGDFSKAREALLKSVQGSDRAWMGWYELGLTYKSFNEMEKAKDAFKRAAEIGYQPAKEELKNMEGGK